jgi:DNA-binding GntR family transcriptional regulator
VATATRRTSRRTVYETLRRKVLTLEFPPGSALSENELAAQLGVSRTPVREQVFPQVGSFVSRVDPARVADAQFLREAVELASLEDLPAQLDPGIVRELRENLAAQRRPDLDVEEFFALDEAFHHALLRLSGHGNAWATVVSAKGHLDRARRLGLQATAPPAFTDQHVEILDAVLAGDVAAARKAMRAHLRAVFDDVERIRQRSPELFARNADSVPVRRNVVVWE